MWIVAYFKKAVSMVTQRFAEEPQIHGPCCSMENRLLLHTDTCFMLLIPTPPQFHK
jgi:hypothetical protein